MGHDLDAWLDEAAPQSTCKVCEASQELRDAVAIYARRRKDGTTKVGKRKFLDRYLRPNLDCTFGMTSLSNHIRDCLSDG